MEQSTRSRGVGWTGLAAAALLGLMLVAGGPARWLALAGLAAGAVGAALWLRAVKRRWIAALPAELDLQPAPLPPDTGLERVQPLLDAGFEHIADYRLVDVAGPPDSRARLWVHREQRVFAELGEVRGEVHLTLVSLLADGHTLSTTDRPVDGAAWALRLPTYLYRSLPGAGADALLSRHLADRERLRAEPLADLTWEAWRERERAMVAAVRAGVAQRPVAVLLWEALRFGEPRGLLWAGDRRGVLQP